MPKSSLIVYEPIEKFGRMIDYWTNYVSFYEAYWGGPTSPYGVWFSDDYRDFHYQLSKFLNVDEIQDCLFMKDSNGQYLISPFRSFNKKYMLYSDNHIPLQWFVLFEDEERKFLYTHMGFGRIHYGTDIHKCLHMINKADKILDETINKYNKVDKEEELLLKLKSIQSQLFELKVWLSEFDKHSYVLLDYGELCTYINPYNLNKDHSSKDLWKILDSLINSDISESGQRLHSFLKKWENIEKNVSDNLFRKDIQ